MEQKGTPFWSRETLRWYLRAAAYGEYHQKLAELLAPWIEGSVCDLGCGPGCLALALLRHVPEVTAIDTDGEAIASLRERAEPGLKLLRGDAMSLPEEMLWDTLILSFFGRITEPGHLEYFLRHCGKRLISIVGGGAKSSFSATGSSAKKKEYVPQVERYLREKGCCYHLEEYALEFGQPLRDLDDAQAFVRHNSPKDCPPPDREELRKRLTPLDNGEFYLPYKKHIGIFVIERDTRS